MKVDQTNLREVVFDCPWVGHLRDPGFMLRNTADPRILGLRCLKCGALIYEFVEVTQIVGADGAPLVATPAPTEKEVK